MTCAFMDGGNLTEEYTNLPTLLALYMALRVFGQEKIGEKLFLPAAGMGVCAAAAFSLRANNALPIFALVAVLAAGRSHNGLPNWVSVRRVSRWVCWPCSCPS